MKMDVLDLLRRRYFRFQRVCSEGKSYNKILYHRTKVSESERMALEQGYTLRQIRNLQRACAERISGKGQRA